VVPFGVDDTDALGRAMALQIDLAGYEHALAAQDRSGAASFAEVKETLRRRIGVCSPIAIAAHRV
jgi:hypothetical protein